MKIIKSIFSKTAKLTVFIIVLINFIIMSADYQWKRDYNRSLIEDDMVLAAFSGWGYTGAHVDSTVKNSDYDAILRKGNKTYSIEVKNDFSAAKTRNFFVETGNAKGKPSGLTASKATHTVFTMPQSGLLFAIKTDLLRDLISDNDWREKQTPTMGVLIPVAQIAQYCVTKTYGDTI